MPAPQRVRRSRHEILLRVSSKAQSLPLLRRVPPRPLRGLAHWIKMGGMSATEKIEWFCFPQSLPPPQLARRVVAAFEEVQSEIDSQAHTLNANAVLFKVGPGLRSLGFDVESGKKEAEKIPVPVLFGKCGEVEKRFFADAWHKSEKFVLEVEAGMAVANYKFLKDLFEASMMVDVDYLAIAVRKIWRAGRVDNRDFNTVLTFFQTLYASERLRLPLKGVLLLGY